MTAFYINEGADLYVETIEYYLSLCGPGTLPPEDPNYVAPYFIEFVAFSSAEECFCIKELLTPIGKSLFLISNILLAQLS